MALTARRVPVCRCFSVALQMAQSPRQGVSEDLKAESKHNIPAVARVKTAPRPGASAGCCHGVAVVCDVADDDVVLLWFVTLLMMTCRWTS